MEIRFSMHQVPEESVERYSPAAIRDDTLNFQSIDSEGVLGRQICAHFSCGNVGRLLRSKVDENRSDSVRSPRKLHGQNLSRGRGAEYRESVIDFLSLQFLLGVGPFLLELTGVRYAAIPQWIVACKIDQGSKSRNPRVSRPPQN